MPDNRNTYILRDDGDVGLVRVADEVIAVIAGLAATEVKGVASIAGGITNNLVSRKGIKALSRGVKTSVSEGLVTIDLALNLDYGYSIPEIGEQVQKKVKTAIENMTGLKVTDVNINVADVALEDN